MIMIRRTSLSQPTHFGGVFVSSWALAKAKAAFGLELRLRIGVGFELGLALYLIPLPQASGETVAHFSVESIAKVTVKDGPSVLYCS